MAMRATASGTLSFGLVAIPLKLYTAAASESVRFNMLHTKCSGRLKMQYYCPTDDEVVERSDTMKGYEYARGQYVTFTEDELKALQTERTNSMEIAEFVPLESVDFVQVEKSYYLAPDKGGDKPYQLLRDAMSLRGVVGVARWAARGKEQVVLVRPYGEHGLILHQIYYANEVRDFEELDTGATYQFSDVERGLATQLIDQLTRERFEPEKYKDSYSERVREAVDRKVEGQEVTLAPEAPKAQIIDLFEALKKSLGSAKPAAPSPTEEEAPKPPAKAKPARAKGVKKASPRKAAPKKKAAGSK